VDEGGSELCNAASRLRRGATEWEPASPFWDGPDVNDHAPKFWWDGDRTLFHFARGQSENIVRTSTDSGATWSKARIFQPCGELGNQLLRTRESFLVMSYDLGQTSLVISRDGGQTWTCTDATRGKSGVRPGGSGFRHAGIHAPLVQLADGRLMAIGRTGTVDGKGQFAAHAPMSYSSDFGATWTYQESEFPTVGTGQRPVMLRLREGPLLLCSFTDQRRFWPHPKGLAFRSASGRDFTGYGLFATISLDEGKTWPVRKLITPGGPGREAPSIDLRRFTLSDTMAEPAGYLAATQTRDGCIQLISSKNHYVFNLAWLKQLPAGPP
jgi:hypothetical protein